MIQDKEVKYFELYSTFLDEDEFQEPYIFFQLVTITMLLFMKYSKIRAEEKDAFII